jgi:hypothetical protein
MREMEFELGINDMTQGKLLRKLEEFENESSYDLYCRGYMTQKAQMDYASGIQSNMSGFTEKQKEIYYMILNDLVQS